MPEEGDPMTDDGFDRKALPKGLRAVLNSRGSGSKHNLARASAARTLARLAGEAPAPPAPRKPARRRRRDGPWSSRRSPPTSASWPRPRRAGLLPRSRRRTSRVERRPEALVVAALLRARHGRGRARHPCRPPTGSGSNPGRSRPRGRATKRLTAGAAVSTMTDCRVRVWRAGRRRAKPVRVRLRVLSSPGQAQKARERRGE